jgi:hypothetical protein
MGSSLAASRCPDFRQLDLISGLEPPLPGPRGYAPAEATTAIPAQNTTAGKHFPGQDLPSYRNGQRVEEYAVSAQAALLGAQHLKV